LSNIYDYFTKKQFDQISHQDYAENERVIEAYGKYIGVLTRQQAQALRNTMDILVAMQAQIENLMQEYKLLLTEYNKMVIDATRFLEAERKGVKYSPETYDLYVDKDGHCWVVPKSSQKGYKSY